MMNSLKNYFLCENFIKYRSLYLLSGQKVWKSSSSSSSSSSDSDGVVKQKATNKEKIDKLNELLTKLVENDKVAKKSDLKLSQPTKKFSHSKTDKKPVPVQESEDAKLFKAAKEAAKEVGGKDAKQVESELLSKLLGPTEAQEATSTKSLLDIVKGMKIDRETKPVEQSKADQIRNILQRAHSRSEQRESQAERRVRRPRSLPPTQQITQKIDLFGSEPLGVFTNKSKLKNVAGNKTWNALYERDLRLAVTHPPSNYFQQMILWTEQGKVWKFPIDNEQGLEEEKKVSFDQHIFLEQHLEPWCPQKGPIRHFMELVCVGLSKNPYLTVDAKKEHIEWYKNYFEEKKSLLQEVGAIPTQEKDKQKQIK